MFRDGLPRHRYENALWPFQTLVSSFGALQPSARPDPGCSLRPVGTKRASCPSGCRQQVRPCKGSFRNAVGISGWMALINSSTAVHAQNRANLVIQRPSSSSLGHSLPARTMTWSHQTTCTCAWAARERSSTRTGVVALCLTPSPRLLQMC